MHQRLAAGPHLLRDAVCAKNGGAGNEQQQQHDDRQRDRKDALLALQVGSLGDGRGCGGGRRLAGIAFVLGQGLPLCGVDRLVGRGADGVAAHHHRLVLEGLDRLDAVE